MGETSHQNSAESVHLPVASPPRNHGHTTAAWVLVVAVLIGAVVSAIAVMAAQPVLFWVGLLGWGKNAALLRLERWMFAHRGEVDTGIAA